MSTPLISIIVPIYKVEPYLRRCLDSIVNQTYTNLEIILVDDGSPDGCPAICDEYAAKDKRIIVIHKENGGLSDARNAGLDICKGEYISFVDSDDWVSERYIEDLLKVIQFENADIAIGEHQKTASETPIKQPNFFYKIYSNTEALSDLYRNKFISFTISWGILYKKELFSKIRFPLHKFHEDTFTSFRLFFQAKKIIHINSILYYYFQRIDSITAQDHPWDLLESCELQYNFFKEKNLFKISDLILPKLCWQYLYILWFESNERKCVNKKTFEKFTHYVNKMQFTHTNPIHFIFLKFFAKFPQAYFFYRKKSPFLIRKR